LRDALGVDHMPVETFDIALELEGEEDNVLYKFAAKKQEGWWAGIVQDVAYAHEQVRWGGRMVDATHYVYFPMDKTTVPVQLSAANYTGIATAPIGS
jgi:hypothetical protein